MTLIETDINRSDQCKSVHILAIRVFIIRVIRVSIIVNFTP